MTSKMTSDDTSMELDDGRTGIDVNWGDKSFTIVTDDNTARIVAGGLILGLIAWMFKPFAESLVSGGSLGQKTREVERMQANAVLEYEKALRAAEAGNTL